MIRNAWLPVLLATAGLAVQALAADPNRPIPPRRQLAVCMTKRMTASRTLSYNAASALCKAALKAPEPALAAVQPRPTNGGAR